MTLSLTSIKNILFAGLVGTRTTFLTLIGARHAPSVVADEPKCRKWNAFVAEPT